MPNLGASPSQTKEHLLEFDQIFTTYKDLECGSFGNLGPMRGGSCLVLGPYSQNCGLNNTYPTPKNWVMLVY
jgi:hypothetical protein